MRPAEAGNVAKSQGLPTSRVVTVIKPLPSRSRLSVAAHEPTADLSKFRGTVIYAATFLIDFSIFSSFLLSELFSALSFAFSALSSASSFCRRTESGTSTRGST